MYPEPTTVGNFVPPSPHLVCLARLIGTEHTYHPSNPISPILPASALKVNFSEKTDTMMVYDPATSPQYTMVLLPIQHTANASQFVPPSSLQGFPLKGTALCSLCVVRKYVRRVLRVIWMYL